jgi:hypothetical protein
MDVDELLDLAWTLRTPKARAFLSAFFREEREITFRYRFYTREKVRQEAAAEALKAVGGSFVV